MPTREVDPEQFYDIIKQERRNQIILIVIGLIMIIGAIVIVSLVPNIE